MSDTTPRLPKPSPRFAGNIILARQLAEPVRWSDCVLRGLETFPGVECVELGSGRVLTGLLKRIRRGTPCTAFGTAADVEAFLEAAS